MLHAEAFFSNVFSSGEAGLSAALLVAGIQGIGSGYVFLEPPRNFDAMLAWTSLFPQFDLSRPSPSNEACYVLLSLLDSTPCLVLFLMFPFAGLVPIETRHSTGLSGFIFLFFEYACKNFYIPPV